MRLELFLSIFIIALTSGCIRHEDTSIGAERKFEKDTAAIVIKDNMALGKDIDSVIIENFNFSYKFYKSKPGEIRILERGDGNPYSMPQYVTDVVFESIDALYISKIAPVVEWREYYENGEVVATDRFPFDIKIYTNNNCIQTTLETDRAKEACFDTYSPYTTILIEILNSQKDAVVDYLSLKHALKELSERQ